jgi:hypothetical protein
MYLPVCVYKWKKVVQLTISMGSCFMLQGVFREENKFRSLKRIFVCFCNKDTISAIQRLKLSRNAFYIFAVGFYPLKKIQEGSAVFNNCCTQIYSQSFSNCTNMSVLSLSALHMYTCCFIIIIKKTISYLV